MTSRYILTSFNWLKNGYKHGKNFNSITISRFSSQLNDRKLIFFLYYMNYI